MPERWPDRQLVKGGVQRYPRDEVHALRGKEAPVIAPADESVESPRFMWLMAAVLFGVGASIGALSLIVPHPASFDDGALWSNIALSYVGALACVAAASRAPAWPIHIAARPRRPA